MIQKKPSPVLILCAISFSLMLFIRCSDRSDPENKTLDDAILTDTSDFYYIDAKEYPAGDRRLPVGIFDSGTGGLTVMDAVINFDGFNNKSMSGYPDGVPDFREECFIYLADQANMPYGNYPSAGKTGFLKELILKDIQFLLGRKYYLSASDKEFKEDKLPVKAIVVACNTATAYGIEDAENFLRKAGLNIGLIGVINAGVRGAFGSISEKENCSIGVMATEGTVLSNGYVNAIDEYRSENGYTGEVRTYQQAGIGLAGAIDGVIDYINPGAEEIRKEYKGPSLTSGEAKIDLSILNRYNFDWTDNRILYSGSRSNPSELQLNSIENYIYYNIVSLLEGLRTSVPPGPLKTIILGCTHYPFYKNIFAEKLKELYNLKEDGRYVYRYLMAEDIILIDPALNTAEELFNYLKDNDLFGYEGLNKSEFYISVPNILNRNVELDSAGNFTYEYKYGRSAGEIQEYVKRVPFSKQNLNSEVIKMLKEKTPVIYNLIREFNLSNAKTGFLRKNNSILKE